ncbi:hypothetical protein Golax_023075, partial [Gossypium laxum]|nr:hypothetical protein [Gossypium laxum]
MELEFAGLSLDEEEEEILRVQVDPESVREEEALSLVGCFLTASHNDSFCKAKMEAGVEVDEMGWDMSLCAQSIRAQAMSSVWLREEGGSVGRISRRDDLRGNSEWGGVRKFEGTVDPILGFNLEGKRSSSQLGRVRTFLDNSQMAMDHDLENDV